MNKSFLIESYESGDPLDPGYVSFDVGYDVDGNIFVRPYGSSAEIRLPVSVMASVARAVERVVSYYSSHGDLIAHQKREARALEWAFYELRSLGLVKDYERDTLEVYMVGLIAEREPKANRIYKKVIDLIEFPQDSEKPFP